MKKIIVALFIVVMTCSAVFAADEPIAKYDSINFAFHPTMPRYNAMGQSGLAYMSRMDSFFSNPAVLGNDGFGLSIPNFSVTLYNVKKLVTDSEAMDILEKQFKGTSTKEENDKLLMKILENLGKGYNDVMDIDAGLAVKMGFFGIGGNVQIKVHGLNSGSSFVSQKLIPEINTAQTVAFGFKPVDTDIISVSIGVSAHAVYKVYFKELGANEALVLKDDSEALLWKSPVMSGYAFPVDAGVTVGFLNDMINISLTANNLNGTYKMKSYTSVGDFADTVSEGAVGKKPVGHVTNDSVAFTVETPWTLNFGFAFTPDIAVLKPVITADFIDMSDLVKKIGSDSFKPSDLLLHLNAGVELGLFDILTVRAGVNRGYMALGCGMWLPGIQIDASYGWQEFGKQLGDKPVDSLTIRFNLGLDKKK
mgnify:CR=1 FL=1